MTENAARVLLFSQRHIDQRIWHASQYEFEDVISAIDDVDLLAPPAPPGGARRIVNAGQNVVRPRLGRSRKSGIPTHDITKDYELFFGVFHFAFELGHLTRLQGRKEHCKKSIAFFIELWEPWVAPNRDYLKLLADFDHVFIFSRWSAPNVSEIAGVPCTFLSTATDTLRYCPLRPVERVIDVLQYGRRNESVHHALLDTMLDDPDFYYSYQTADGPFVVKDYLEHRILSAETLRRSDATVVYDVNDNQDRLERSGGEPAMTTRYFETVASGAVVLGSAPDSDDFRDAFDWTDAVVPLPASAQGVRETLAALAADPERVALMRRSNVAGTLRKHDWAHRWSSILHAAGLEPTPALLTRLDELAAHAKRVQDSTAAL